MRYITTVISAAFLVLFVAHIASAIEIALTFEELVSQADTIFVGRVESSRSRWENTTSGRAIVTDVTFAVERVYKGRPMTQTTLRFLGGTVGDVSLAVEEVPAFNAGDREMLFVSADAKAANPLIGGGQGRYRVQTNASGRESVTPADDPAAKPVALQELEARIARALKRRP